MNSHSRPEGAITREIEVVKQGGCHKVLCVEEKAEEGWLYELTVEGGDGVQNFLFGLVDVGEDFSLESVEVGVCDATRSSRGS